MKALKTIIATAVIVFALTTVAMAGVQHLTKQGGQATGSQARAAQPTYTLTLTAAQLAQLVNGGRVAATGGVQHARQTKHHATKARHQVSSHHAGTHQTRDATRASASSSGGTHHYGTTDHASYSTSTSGSHHAETGHDSGEGHGGGSCGD